MENDKNTTVGELGEKLKSLEQEISVWAKAGMRAYTTDELVAYEASKTLIDFLESKGFVNGEKMKAYWVSHSPTQHPTIKDLKPFDAKGDETEVFDKVIEKIANGNSDVDDKMFIKEVEKRSGVVFMNEETINMGEELKNITNRLNAIKKKIAANV